MGGDFKGEGLSEPADSPFGGGVVGSEGEGAVGYNAKGFQRVRLSELWAQGCLTLRPQSISPWCPVLSSASRLLDNN